MATAPQLSPKRNRDRMILRLRNVAGRNSKVEILEPRRRHFRKTLYLAGALSLIVVCLYFFAHASAVEAHDVAPPALVGVS